MFINRIRESNRDLIKGTNLPFKFVDGVEVINPVESSVIVGRDNQRNNISLIYNEEESGLYRNNPRTPLLVIDNDNKIIFGPDLVVSSEGDASILIDADTSGTGIGSARLILANDEQTNLTAIESSTSDVSIFRSGSALGSSANAFRFILNDSVIDIDELPEFTNDNLILELNNDNMFSYKDIVASDSSINVEGSSQGIYIKTNPSFTNNTSCQLHTMSNGSLRMWQEADINNIGETDLPFYNMSYDGGFTLHQIAGLNNRMGFNTATSSLVNNGFDFNIGTINSASPQGTLPVITGSAVKLRIDVALTTSYNQLSMNSNPITSVSQITINKTTALQISSIVTGVTLNASCGKIFTVVTTLGPLGVAIFTVSNGSVAASNVILANVIAYTGTYGTAGLPVVHVGNIGSETFDIILINTSSTTALNGSVGIGFVVV